MKDHKMKWYQVRTLLFGVILVSVVLAAKLPSNVSANDGGSVTTNGTVGPDSCGYYINHHTCQTSWVFRGEGEGYITYEANQRTQINYSLGSKLEGSRLMLIFLPAGSPPPAEAYPICSQSCHE